MIKIITPERWVMLPTDEKTGIYIWSGDVYFDKNLEYAHRSDQQHLYLISDEETMPGDWCIHIVDNGSVNSPHKDVYKFLGIKDGLDQFIDTEGNKMNSGDWPKLKIIATTDKSLFKIIGDKIVDASVNAKEPIAEQVAQIPESFVKYFVEKQGDVGDVEVEYNAINVKYSDFNHIKDKQMRNFMRKESTPISADFILKLTDDNEIVFHIPKDRMYSKTEVMHIIRDVHNVLGVDSQYAVDYIRENLKK